MRRVHLTAPGSDQRVHLCDGGTTEAAQACREAAEECLNIVTASAGCKVIMAQSCFRFSDVSVTWFLQFRESLYCRLCAERRNKRPPLALRNILTGACLFLWICCSCVMSKAHFLCTLTRVVTPQLLSVTPKHAALVALTDTSSAEVVLIFPDDHLCRSRIRTVGESLHSPEDQDVCVNVIHISPDLQCFGEQWLWGKMAQCFDAGLLSSVTHFMAKMQKQSSS